jgi:hypothetical protein
MKQPPPQSGPPEFYYEQTPEQVCAWQVYLHTVLTSFTLLRFPSREPSAILAG